jgi:hypothetical protein
MILTLALALAASTPEDALSRSMGDYTECLRVEAGSGDFTRQLADERTAFAMAQCRSRREATIQLAVELLSPQYNAEVVRARFVEALEGIEAIFPAFLMASGGVDIPRSIAPAVRRYSACLKEEMDERGATANLDAATYRTAAEASLAACSTVRAETIGESETVLAGDPNYLEADRRRAAIQHAFDGTDSLHRNFVEIMDVVLRELGTNASN